MDTNLTVPSKVNWKKFTQRNFHKQLSWKKYLLWHQMLLSKLKETVETPVVYIPVFPGTNSEYDSAKAFEKEGAKKSTSTICNTE